jgi:Bacterial aa3 type cytochrome c oxidase subunit IV
MAGTIPIQACPKSGRVSDMRVDAQGCPKIPASNSPHCVSGRFALKALHQRLGMKMAEANHEAMTSHDFSDHKGTYEGFLRMASIGTVWVLGIVASLAIGGTTLHWGLASFLLILATIASVAGLAVRSWGWKPGAVIVVIQLLSLLLLTH